MVRPTWRLRTETRFQYDRFVAREAVDRAEWAKVVQELLDSEARPPAVEGGKPRTHGAKTKFAAKVGLKTTRTIDTWLVKQVKVSEASVKAVADAYGINPMDLMIRVGYYSASEMPSRPLDDVIDDEIQAVLDDPELDDEQRMLIIEQFEAWRTEDRELHQRLAERDRQRRAERLAQLVDQTKRTD